MLTADYTQSIYKLKAYQTGEVWGRTYIYIYPMSATVFTLLAINSTNNPSNHHVNISVTSLLVFVNSNSINK